jgi:DNA-binding winged helix-turn-helix (wHTH) protein
MLNYATSDSAMSTPQATPGSSVLRFGVFELDAAGGELRKNGHRIRLQGQPLQILSLLAERPGEIVTREELRQKLWPADTFVDFDHSLNTAINKIREALGDSASSPRFVETLARRGYRFLAQVERIHPVASSPASMRASPAADVAQRPGLDVPAPRRDLARALFVLIQVMYLVFYAEALFRLGAVDRVLDAYPGGWMATALFAAVLVTAGAGIPVRCYLSSAAGFDHRKLGEKFERMFPALLALDGLWAIAPFLLTGKIGFGGAFAATALLLYVPFAERTLVRMAYSSWQALRGSKPLPE